MQHDNLVELFNNIPDAILSFDDQLRIIFSNEASRQLLQSIELEEMWSTPPISQSAIVQLWWKNLTQVREAQHELTFEFETVESDKSYVFEVYLNPLIKDTEHILISCIVHDITARKELELHQLRLAIQKNQLELAKSLSQHVAHDLRTPLSSILTNIYLLRKTIADKEPIYLDRIEDEIHRITKRVDSIILMNRLDHSEAIEKETTNLSLTLKDIDKSFQQELQHKSQQLISTIEPQLIADADVYYLQRAIENILRNAIQYTNKGGSISLRAFQDQHSIRIEIEDDGIGIQKKHLDHIFDRFYRINSARTSDASTASNGLGLSIAKAIIDQHHGSLDVESVFGQGCNFIIRIPTKTKTSNSKIERWPDKMLSEWDILVIDDDVDNLEMVRYILEYHGASVHTADNGHTGIQIATTIVPRFIICDLSMPDMDGWDVMSVLNTNQTTSSIPVIALTAFDKRENRKRAIDAGFYNYLTKPLTAPVFMDQLLKLLLDIPQLTEYLNRGV